MSYSKMICVDLKFELKLLQHRIRQGHANTYGINPDKLIDRLQVMIHMVDEAKNKRPQGT